MNKKITALLIASLSALICGCSKTEATVAPHRHQFTTYWDSNSQTHFHICTFPGCGVRANIDDHVFDNEELYDENYNIYKYCTFCGHKEFTGEVLPEFKLFNLPEIHYSYPDKIKEYLEMENPDPHGFPQLNQANGFRPLEVKWFSRRNDVHNYVIEYSRNSNFTDAIRVTLPSDATSYDIYNTYKNSTYYVRVTQNYGSNKSQSFVSTTRTTDMGPRLVRIDGISNTRDIGGYNTAAGRTLEGLAFRGTGLKVTGYQCLLTEKGIETFKQLGVKTEIEFRPDSEAGDYDTLPHIENVNLERHIIQGYSDVFNSKYTEAFRNVFKLFADKSSYPIYFHCSAGADRTGTVAFLLNALLGVDMMDLIHDFELTSFYEPGERNFSHSYDGDEYGKYMIEFMKNINKVEGTSFYNKIENIMLNTIGITADDINSIRDIFYGRK